MIRAFVRGLGQGYLIAALAAASLVCGCAGADGDGEEATAFEADEVIVHYLEAQEALAGDRLVEAVAALRLLSASAPAGIRELIANVEDTGAEDTGIGRVRELFESVSEQLIADKPLASGLRVVHCPMALGTEGARWIQRDGDVANPYHGRRMLHCGIFEPAGEGS